jgi:DNA-binding transcriptional ArsR family regulator
MIKVLSDPTRLRIIEKLTLECESVSAIVDATGLSQPLVSHHLRVLWTPCTFAQKCAIGTYIFK